MILLPVPDIPDVFPQVMKSHDVTFEDKFTLTIELLFFGIPELRDYFATQSLKGGGVEYIFQGNKRSFAESVKKRDASAFRHFVPLFNKIEEIIAR